MPRDGSGNFSLSDPPFQFDTVADETVVNAVLADIATALTASLVKDGQTTATADLPMGSHKHTNVENAAARNQYAAAGQVQDDSLKVLGSVSGTNTITGSLTPAITAYATGMSVVFKPAGANTGATTIAVNGLAAKSIVKFASTALVAGDLASGVPALIVYDGTSFLLLNPQVPIPDGSIATGKIAADAITNTLLANMAQATVKGRASGGGTGDPADLSGAQVATIVGYTAADVLTKLLTVDGAGSGIDADSVDGHGPVALGTWTPTDTAVSNVDSVTPGVSLYLRIGAMVVFAIRGSVDFTTAGGTSFQFRLSLPVASNLAASTDAAGLGHAEASGQPDQLELFYVQADTTNDALLVSGLARGTASHSFQIVGMYRVL